VPTPQLAHVASAEGILAVEHIAGKNPEPLDYDRTPGVTYCDPQVASVGLTEKKARERGHKVKCAKFPFMGVGKAAIEDEREGFVKIVADEKHDQVLGVHILHAHAGELIGEGVSVLNGELTVHELAAMHPHPTLTEGLMEAAHAYFGHAIHV
jgi:dihydrolipoamide dehydrogenase